MPYGQAISQVLGLIGGGVAGGLGAGTQNDLVDQKLAAYGNLTPVPDYQKLFMQGWTAQNQMTPEQVYQDFKLRSMYAPAEQEQALNLYKQYAPQYNQANMAMLGKIDPQYLTGYKNLGADVTRDLGYGSHLTPEQLQLDNANINAAQAARGNVRGNANVSAAGLYDANAQDQMYQQRLGNMANFLRQGGPESKFSELGGNAGQAALQQGTGGLTQPGTEYYQIPQNFGQSYVNNSSLGFQQSEQEALQQAQAAYGPGVHVNPWIASLTAGFGALAGGGGKGLTGGGGGGGMPSGGGGGQGSMWSGVGGLGDQASPAYL